MTKCVRKWHPFLVSSPVMVVSLPWLKTLPGGGGLCSRWSGRLWAGTGAPRKALCAPSFPPTPRTRVARVWVACSAARQKEEGRKEGGREEGSQKPGAGGVSRGRMFREE